MHGAHHPDQGLRLQARAADRARGHVQKQLHGPYLLLCSQVALMFLTRGVLHHEAAWALWFAHARGLLPKTLIRARGCEPGLLQALAAACGAAASPRLLQQQHLFSVYVHVGANDAEFVGAPAPFHNLSQKRCKQRLQQ